MGRTLRHGRSTPPFACFLNTSAETRLEQTSLLQYLFALFPICRPITPFLTTPPTHNLVFHLLLKIVLVNYWVAEGCITWSVWGVVDLLLYHWLCDLRETTDVSDLIGKMEMIISSLYHRIIDKKQVNIYETVCKR